MAEFQRIQDSDYEPVAAPNPDIPPPESVSDDPELEEFRRLAGSDSGDFSGLKQTKPAPNPASDDTKPPTTDHKPEIVVRAQEEFHRMNEEHLKRYGCPFNVKQDLVEWYLGLLKLRSRRE